MNFLHNIVADLREKKLLPVVAVLVLTVIAIPVLARNRGASEPRDGGESPAIPEIKAPPSAGQSIVTLEEQPSSKRKKLDAFKRKDPFVQQALGSSKSKASSVTPAGSGDSGGTTTSTDTGSVTAGSGSSGSATSTTGGSSETTGTSDETSGSRGSTGNGGGTSGKRGSGSSGSSKTSTKFYRWTVTVSFGLLGEEASRDDLTLLSPLPSSEDPVVTFLGISQNSRAAVFLLDRGVLQEGEGTCRPSPTICTYVYLRKDDQRNEHTFYRESDPDRKYRIKLKSVDLVESKSPVKLKTSQDAQSLGSSLRLSVHHDVRNSG